MNKQMAHRDDRIAWLPGDRYYRESDFDLTPREWLRVIAATLVLLAVVAVVLLAVSLA
jgi:hypothetical protein